MHFLLLVLLALACLPDSKTAWPQPPWDGTAISALLTGLAVAVTVLLAHRIARQARTAKVGFLAREEQLTKYEHGRGRHQWLLFALFAVELVVLGWGNAVGQWQTTYDLPLPELFILAPFLASLLLSWACFYDAERGHANRTDVLNPPAVVEAAASFAGTPAAALNRPRSRGGRWSYVLFQARQKLALVCVPLALMLLMKELVRRVPQETWDHWQLLLQIGVAAILLAMLIAMPWLVRFALGLVPLPDGALKKRLMDTAHRLRFRCSGFLLWRTRRSMANAMVVGILPWPRYVIFTDRLLEEFTAEEVEAVLGHEMGHIKHGHMPFYLAFLMTSCLIATIAATIFWVPADDKGNAPATAATEEISSAPEQPGAKREFFALRNHPYLNDVPAVAGTVVYVFLVFGFVSRRCERQADLYGCRAVSCASPRCDDHEDVGAIRSAPTRVCRTGVEIFVQALEKVALLNDIPRERPGVFQAWQHSTIAKRVAFLRSLQNDPHAEPAFQRRIWLLKAGILLVLGTVLTALVVWRTTGGSV